MRTAATLLIVITAGLAPIGGCAAPTARHGLAPVEAGGYAASFDRARETLIDLGFTLNRVDAAAGVITTAPEPSDGLAAPWERHQVTLSNRVADTVHAQSKVVRIEFAPARTYAALSSDEPRTQIEPGRAETVVSTEGPMIAQVTVLVERRFRPGLRPQVADITRSRRATDPNLSTGRAFGVIVERDEPLEDLIAGRIAESR